MKTTTFFWKTREQCGTFLSWLHLTDGKIDLTRNHEALRVFHDLKPDIRATNNGRNLEYTSPRANRNAPKHAYRSSFSTTRRLFLWTDGSYWNLRKEKLSNAKPKVSLTLVRRHQENRLAGLENSERRAELRIFVQRFAASRKNWEEKVSFTLIFC